MWRSGLIGALLAAGCTLDSTPDASNESMRAVHESTAWQPDTLARAGASMDRAGSGARDAAVQTANAAGAKNDPPSTSAAGAQASPTRGHDDGGSQRAASGAAGKSVMASGAGGQAGGAMTAPQPSAAGAPAAGSGADDSGLAGSLVDLTLGILFGATDVTVETADGVLEGAATAGGLTASLVSGVLESLTTTGVCAAEPDQCEQVCGVIRKDCKACAGEETCRGEVRATCGDETADCVEQAH